MTTDRYHRQIIFPEWGGQEGQAKLGKARVVLAGCGGLGSTLAQCMVRAGIGRLTVIDKDIVGITNLHRQFLFDEDDVRNNVSKAVIAAEKLRKADSNVEIAGIDAEISESNADALLSGHDLVLDGMDNMESRYVINGWCIKNRVPWIYGGVVGATGMTMVILPGKGPCLRCLYLDAEPFPAGASPIINTLPLVIAALQATEAIKLIIGSPDLIKDLRIIDLWTGDYQQIPIQKNPDCPCCGKSS